MVSSGLDDKLPYTKWLKQHSFSTVLEAEKLGSKCQHGQGFDEGSLQTVILFLQPQRAEKEITLVSLLLRALMP